MNFSNYYQQLPSDITLSFASAEENEELMKEMDVNQLVTQLGKGEFHCGVAERVIDDVTLVSDRFNTAISVYLEPPEDTICLMLATAPDSEISICGQTLEHDVMTLLPSNYAVDIVSKGMSGSDSIMLSKARFAQISQSVTPFEEVIDVATHIQINRAEAMLWRNAIVNSINNNIEPEAVANMMSVFIARISEGAGSNYSDLPIYADKRVKVARQVRDYLHAHYQQKISLDILCEQIGISMRSLQRCFKDYFGCSILAYLQAMRLKAVHKQIINNQHLTVSDIAMQHGFSHLGRFSTEFKKHFGISAKQLQSSYTRKQFS
ncbi:helix-turn-helix domain-containing protein [Thalassomonas sp. M1454]|uniref:helix-turn-helix domain-containing protein n=1 Tax=Thalassomonas sp. M1454 TaxID=2594477 RepID=UPI00117F488F|nr:helix-turn-helix domain-containing protein [Thalassomonas sp. M1454]TRX56470.1 helix-turn-helix domain-containing protein [Thalassomonas sp. M1454]